MTAYMDVASSHPIALTKLVNWSIEMKHSAYPSSNVSEQILKSIPYRYNRNLVRNQPPLSNCYFRAKDEGFRILV